MPKETFAVFLSYELGTLRAVTLRSSLGYFETRTKKGPPVHTHDDAAAIAAHEKACREVNAAWRGRG